MCTDWRATKSLLNELSIKVFIYRATLYCYKTHGNQIHSFKALNSLTILASRSDSLLTLASEHSQSTTLLCIVYKLFKTRQRAQIRDEPIMLKNYLLFFLINFPIINYWRTAERYQSRFWFKNLCHFLHTHQHINIIVS